MDMADNIAYPKDTDWWVCYTQHTKPTFLTEHGTGQKDRRDRALTYLKHKSNCIDVGSNVGFWTRDLRRIFNRVYCFEPNPVFRECFLKNLPQDNIELLPYGLSNREHTASQSFNSTQMQDEPGGVECRTLDSFQLKDIDFVKIDVDGFEIQVLGGATKTLEQNNPVINIEMKRGKRPHIVTQSEKILRSLGYSRVDRVKTDEIWIKS